MSDTAIIANYNGRDVILDDLVIPANDRAVMFGDAVYEVLRVYDGHPFLLERHLGRLARSLKAMDIAVSIDIAELVSENIERNQTREGMVYLQISRGAAPRNHSFFNLALTPNIMVYTKTFPTHPTAREQEQGISAITHEDLRWSRCDIKTTNLLANCLIQTKANRAHAAEALLFRHEQLTEGTSSNVFIVKDGEYITPPLSQFILPGTRRQFVLELLRDAGHPVTEREIHKNEVSSADEIFITSTIKEVVPIVALDGKNVGTGSVGPHVQMALSLFTQALKS